MNKTITLATKLREPNFGRPQPEDITHIAVRMTTKNEKVYLPVVERARGAYWSVQPEGRSGFWWTFTAELPTGFHGQYVAEFTRYYPEYGYLPV